MEKVRLFANTNRNIAHTDEVERALGDLAFQILEKARTRLSRHRKTGSARITQTKGTVDHFVNLVDEEGGAIAMEVGWHTKDGTFVPGLRILRGSL